MSNAKQFALEIDRELAGAEDEFRTIIRALALRALQGVVGKTPVDTGRARGNWFVQIGDAGTEITTNVDKSGTVTIATGNIVLATYKDLKGFPVISIYNNLPYINRLESGSSGQAPAGMVAVTLAELQASL